MVVFEGGEGSELDERGRAGGGGIDEGADGLDDLGVGNGEADAPAAHAVGLAEGVGGEGVVEHVGFGEDGLVAGVGPDHVAVRFVAEDDDVGAADEVGDGVEVVAGGDAAGGVVGGVEPDGAGLGVGFEEAFDGFGGWSELVIGPEWFEDGAGATAGEVGFVGGEVG